MLTKKLKNLLVDNEFCNNHIREYEKRFQQIQMLEKITDAIFERKNLIVEAGTGVGKSLAYLLPAIFYAVNFDKKVVISHLKGKTEKGIPALADVKDIMKYEVIKEKKAEMYTEKMKGSNLNEIAANVGLSVKTASNISGNASSVAGAGNEPKMIGAAFATPQGQVSKPIKGKNGVFVVSTTNKNEATAPEGYTFDSEQNISNSQLRRQAQSGVYQALYELSDLEDKRNRFRYIGR